MTVAYWQMLVDVAILVRGLDCYLRGKIFPFLNSKPTNGVRYIEIPDNIVTVISAREFIESN